MSKLLVITGPDQGKEFGLDDVLLSIGRDPRNTVRLADKEVSRVHAYIKLTNGGYVIADRNSSNGTYVNERRVQKYRLNPQDVIRCGQTTLLFDSKPVQSMIDVTRLVNISSRNADDSSSAQIVRTVSAKVALPAYDDDSQITDSFLEHLEENIHVIYHTAIATSRITDITELHQKVLSLVFEWTKADRGCVLLTDEEFTRVTPAAFRQREDLSRLDPIEVSEEILKRAAERNEGVITSDVVTDPKKRRGAAELKPGSVIESMCAPMHGRMGIVGFLYVDNIVPLSDGKTKARDSIQSFEKSFTVPQLKMLLAIGHQAALATENAIYYNAMNQNAQMAAVGETFTQIAHHIRNMLQGIDISKRRMNQGIDKKNWDLLHEGWREIEPLTARIYELSLNLLSFSKPRDPQLQLDSINDCVGDVVGTVEGRAKNRGIKLDWEPNLNLKPFLFDTESMYRAILNVVQNALDACSLGCVVKIRVVETDGNVEVSVIDDGEGIDPRKIGLVFKPFATTKGELGTGVGLPVTQKILREHGGEVRVTSTLGHGSNFTLSLPARRAKPLDDFAQAPDTAMGEKQGRQDTDFQ